MENTITVVTTGLEVFAVLYVLLKIEKKSYKWFFSFDGILLLLTSNMLVLLARIIMAKVFPFISTVASLVSIHLIIFLVLYRLFEIELTESLIKTMLVFVFLILGQLTIFPLAILMSLFISNDLTIIIVSMLAQIWIVILTTIILSRIRDQIEAMIDDLSNKPQVVKWSFGYYFIYMILSTHNSDFSKSIVLGVLKGIFSLVLLICMGYLFNKYFIIPRQNK
ncbi:MAG TPA: hypothetical protein VJ962_04865 [Clostridia bacterium]|nr:hypothetical protein [Clostridia bacterium]